ncbi:Transcriptional regulator, TetR family OS=Tsukamurella paurometabola (strain ATCC 8368 / DSM/ CCUG 35730 / CIP 100753 / JCM 10117 / KCTC 9821 / NBRC 16120/ NCIMB 702349 / NCTC 13040) OX=521096 GN=Tpau_2572 PE=4 SV=1 [Tsukamurella paurometabola]|uniref:Transcriptional regulator, TetR family n=2 Tax=Tsukamurella paurometabola TaxID=2061 RepID=D5URX0_TSUPD|nr:transcriptional regulator, TetR family [Tsukamurella paurometabola DSM 20162]SUP34400.1 Tetracycline repressor protein class H [Tsukamurella paurometabola]
MTCMSATSPRRGRPTKDDTHLSRTSIVDAALALIDAEGIAAVSMRTVGRSLGVDAKSLYHHVAGKEQLLDAVAERLLESVEVHRPTGDVRADLRANSWAFRNAAMAHPRAASLFLTRRVQTLAGLGPAQSVLDVLLTAGFPADEAVHLLRSLLAIMIGTMLREVESTPTFGETDDDAIAQREAALAGSELSAVRLVAADLARYDPETEFEYMVDLCGDAVVARWERRRAEEGRAEEGRA